MIVAYIDGGAQGQPRPGGLRRLHPGLQALHAKATLLAHEVGRVTFEHIHRELNKEADRLSDLGMDAAEESLKSSG